MVARLAAQHGCEVVRIIRSEENLDGQALTREALNGVDVAIEFTTPGAAIVNVKSMAFSTSAFAGDAFRESFESSAYSLKK